MQLFALACQVWAFLTHGHTGQDECQRGCICRQVYRSHDSSAFCKIAASKCNKGCKAVESTPSALAGEGHSLMGSVS